MTPSDPREAGEPERSPPEPNPPERTGDRHEAGAGRAGEAAEADPVRTGGDADGEAGDAPLACDVCGSPMYERHCRIICPVCGYQRDCSDP